MERLLQGLDRAIWGWPLLLLLLGTGLYLLIRLRFLPIRMLPAALKLVLHPQTTPGLAVSPFGAFCTALSATIGTGNMVGVATALSLGGPGALFWMELSAFTGLALKYAEGLLAVAYRKRRKDGGWFGGPFAYIALGLGPHYRFLGRAFSLCGALAGLCGVGTFVQIGSVTACLTVLLSDGGHAIRLVQLPWGPALPLAGIVTGLLLSVLAVRFLFGGIGRISRFSARIVPFMCGLYLLCCGWILIRYGQHLPTVLRSVFASAWDRKNLGAGVFGAIVAGVSRGIFSNEAGLGTAPIAAACAEGVSPVEQGLISMSATVFDTFLICTLTGLVILVTGSAGAGVGAVMLAFAKGLPLPAFASKLIVFLLLTMFAFTTVIGWSVYGTACLEDLFGPSVPMRRAYLLVYAATVALAPLCSVQGIWTAANICNGLMAFPNVIAILLLSDKIVKISSPILDFPRKKRYTTSSFTKFSCKEYQNEEKARSMASHIGTADGSGPVAERLLRFGESAHCPGDRAGVRACRGADDGSCCAH